jgi:aryl-alcohol dehydrogenase-like predicted oxidoreductase
MKHRPLGRTGLYVSEICLGTMTFGGQGAWWKAVGEVDQSNANALVERALAAGVNFIDTADVYSEGLSEQILGRRCAISRCPAKASSSQPRCADEPVRDPTPSACRANTS